MPITLLDDGAERRHIFFDAAAHPDVRESLAYLLPLPELGLGVIFYTWVHALGEDGRSRAGSAGIVYGPGVAETVFEVHDHIGVPDSLGFDDWHVGPGHLTLSDDMMSSTVAFTGERVAFDYVWEGINPAFGFADNRNGCPQWLAWDRAEQGGRVVGSLTVDGVTHAVDGFATATTRGAFVTGAGPPTGNGGTCWHPVALPSTRWSCSTSAGRRCTATSRRTASSAPWSDSRASWPSTSGSCTSA
jgi:hypothetical protein